MWAVAKPFIGLNFPCDRHMIRLLSLDLSSPAIGVFNKFFYSTLTEILSAALQDQRMDFFGKCVVLHVLGIGDDNLLTQISAIIPALNKIHARR